MMVVLLLVLMPLSAVVNGYVLATLWNWFAVPALSVHTLTVLPAIGLGAVVSKLTYRSDLPTKYYGKDFADIFITLGLEIVLSAGAYLGFGWCVHALMVN